MTLSDEEKRNYINKYFHQYLDLTLDKDFQTTETINLIFSIDDLMSTEKENTFTHNITFPEEYNAEDYLEKYEDTDYEKQNKCTLKRIIDGDTLVVNVEYNNETKEEKIRLVGINTPEENEQGYDVSKEFLEKICTIPDADIYIKIDNEKNHDKYGRLLAILIINNKNINEVLLKEGVAEVQYIPPSEFNPYDWATEFTKIHNYNVISGDDISSFLPYFNPEFTNIVFTPQDDYDSLYPFEVYQNMIYVKLNPFSSNIRLHLLPKFYDCSENILFFKDSFIDRKRLSNDYKYYEGKDYINSYYQINDNDRNRQEIPSSERDYDITKWPNTFCEFSYDISRDTKNMNNLEICAGYRYNESTSYYSVHYTGIKDNTSIAIEDRCALIDANYDNIEDKTNNITQFKYDNNKNLYIPKEKRVIRKKYGDIENRLSDSLIGKLYHKKLKYINDLLYVEEKTFDNNIYYGFADWVDISK